MRALVIFGLRPAHVAQAVEHFLGKEKVPGSNPGVGSNSRSSIRVHREALAAWSRSAGTSHVGPPAVKRAVIRPGPSCSPEVSKIAASGT